MKKIGLIFMLLLLGASMGFAQTTKVSGTVVGKDDGLPIIGAGVFIMGTTKGVVTDIDGNFTINVPAGTKNLTFSYMGMKTIDLPVQAHMNVVMESSTEKIDEVVVTGITSTDKRMFTGAADKLKADDVKLAGMPDVSRSLEGRSAGLSVQNVSSTFGTAPKIRVRGATSIFGDSKPLWIVDGVPMEDVISVSADDLSSGNAETLISSAIAGLNADDIESFDILKDGSATSIYGAKAMAGVIVITTKKGKAGHSSFNYTGEFTLRTVPSYSEYNVMNSQEQMGVYQEMQQKGWLNHASLANASSSGIYGKMYQLIDTYDPVTGQFGLENTAEARAAYLRSAEFRNTDWFDVLFDANILQRHSVSMSSGNDRSNFYASLSTTMDPGWSKASKVELYTGNVNAGFKILKNLEFNIGTTASYRKQRAPGTLSQSTDAVSGEVKRDFDINPYSYAMNTSRALDPDVYYTRSYADFNILHELDNNYIDLNVADLKFQAELKWKPWKNIEWSNMGSIRFYNTTQEHNITDFANQALAYRAMPNSTVRDANPFLYSDPDDPYALPITVLPQGGIYKRTDNSMKSYIFRSTVRYNQTFAEKHIVSFNGGIEINSLQRHQTWFRGWGLQYSMGEVPFYAYQVFKRGVEEGTDYYGLENTRTKMAAFFGNATYSWKRRYTLSGTMRYEGSNKLGKARSARWLPTWNISGSWNVHEEKFFESLRPALSNLTIKASYSLTADSGPAWLTNSAVVIGSQTPWRPYTSVQESGLYISSLANNELTYEKKHEFNIGASIGFLDNRINLDVDWYKRNNYDLIGTITTQGIGGEITKYGNVAEMTSNGLEVSLSTHNIKPKREGGFSWRTDFIYTHTNNEVTKLQGSQRLIDMVIGSGFSKQGYAHNSLFSIPFAGLNENGIPMFYTNVEHTETTTNGIYFQTRDTDNGELDFLKYEGTTDPTDYGSFRNEFSYKGFRLNVFLTYSFGNVIRLDPVFRGYYSDLTSMTKEFKNRWVNPGDELYTTIPVILSARQYSEDNTLSYAYNAYNYSSERIAKGDFIRLKEVSLEYTFPKKLVEPLKINSLSAKIQATNLFLLYADKKLNGQDPEFVNMGGVASPLAKQFTFTLRIGL